MGRPVALALAALSLVAAGCGSDDPAAAPGAAPADAADGAPLVVRGVVVEAVYDGAALRVDHEAMPTLGMPAMQMALPLDEPGLAAGLAPGDKVALTIEAAPRLRITAVRRLPAATPLTLAPPDSLRADTAAAR